MIKSNFLVVCRRFWLSVLCFLVFFNSILVNGKENNSKEYATILSVLKSNNIPKMSNESPFNEVDAMIFSEIVYLPMSMINLVDINYFENIFGNIINELERDESQDNCKNITVKEYYEKLISMLKQEKKLSEFCLHNKETHNCEYYINNYSSDDNKWLLDRLKLLEYMSKCERYKDIIISDFNGKYCDINQSEPEQFATVIFNLDENTKLIAFRGTDCTLAGWKEDADMSWDEETPSQRDSAKYLKKICNKYPNSKFYLAGHSKGGNSAMYSSLKLCEKYPENINKILGIFNFDGPGLRSDIIEKYKIGFNLISRKILVFLPQASIIGRMMMSNSYDNNRVMYVYSTEKGGVSQHNLLSWEVNKLYFKQGCRKFNLTKEVPESELMYDVWEHILKYSQKSYLRIFFEMIFKFLNENNISFNSNENILEITENIFSKCIKYSGDIIKSLFSKECTNENIKIFKDTIDLVLESVMSSYWNKYKKVNESLQVSGVFTGALEDIENSGYVYTNWGSILWAVINKIFDFSFVANLIRELI